MIILLTAVIPALVLIYFIYRKDKYQKEPTSQLLKGFGFGALSALGSFLISVPLMVLGFYPAEATTVGEHISVAVFGAAIPEELAKFFFLWLLLRNNKYYDEYVDGIVYAVCVGMGFAAFENVGYIFSDLENWAQIGIMRALSAIPGHFFFAVMMGYFYSKASFGNPASRGLNIALALLVPMALHAAYDGILMVSDAVGAVGAGLALFFGLYFFMIKTTKKSINKHLSNDETYTE